MSLHLRQSPSFRFRLSPSFRFRLSFRQPEPELEPARARARADVTVLPPARLHQPFSITAFRNAIVRLSNSLLSR